MDNPLSPNLIIEILNEAFYIYKFSPPNKLSPNLKKLLCEILIEGGETQFLSITKTDEETSIVISEKLVNNELKSNLERCATEDALFEKDENKWKAFRVKGQLELTLVGILHKLVTPLKESKVVVFTLSTFNTDYIFVKEEEFARAKGALESVAQII